ncbi:hypothetical protein MNBD_GAMMA06-218 [hydrothermal vent metagenome]|uniref:Uncharacterized protein n=1 Tax=hydrothermal vent metagenome TaxID=652676 RepID=A0A3B0WGL1_9ZZZZ
MADLADLNIINQAAKKIMRQVASGDISEACCMSAAATPVTESWDVAKVLTAKIQLTAAQQQTLLKKLKPEIQQQLESTGFDDFDLIYERLLQLVSATVGKC